MEKMETVETYLARLDERTKSIMQKIEAVHEQVKKTNGRVDKLEDNHDEIISDMNGLHNWKHEVKGIYRAVIAIGASIGAIIGIVIDRLL